MSNIHRFSSELWLWPGDAAWVFATVPEEASEHIRSIPRPPRRGFGSIRVGVTLGSTVWKTSIFPESKSGCYILPVKKAVRAAEGVEVGDSVKLTIELLD